RRDHRVAGELGLQRRARERDHPERALPRLVAGRGVKQYEAAGPELGVVGRQDVGRQSDRVRGKALWCGRLLQVDLGPEPDRAQRFEGARERLGELGWATLA